MILSIIVAAAKNSVIGKKGTMPWHLPGELAYFRKTTSGHPVIMGRVTHEDIGRALPGRYNVVITSQRDYQAEGCQVVNSLDEALQLEAVKKADEAFILGGESVFNLAMPLVDKIYLTKIDAEVQGDKFFNFDASQWREIWSEKHKADARNKYGYEFTILERQK